MNRSSQNKMIKIFYNDEYDNLNTDCIFKFAYF